jgi:mannitol/fructose-specific phosphotransferase system IIA component (Ntr-type)
MLRLFQRSLSYLSLAAKDKRRFVPPTTEIYKTPQDFLTRIGRQCDTVAEKFTSWEQLFTSSSREMEEWGIKPQMRKYILGRREYFSKHLHVTAIEIPKRRNKHLKRKEQVKLLRLKKLGLA